MISVDNQFPQFRLTAVNGTDPKTAFSEVTNSSYEGKWLVVFFYPKDFTFVCPTEITGFNDLNKEFTSRNAQVLGVSVDSEYSHLAWKNQHPDLKNLTFPLLSDIKKELSSALGVLDHNSGVANRATFIVNPKGIVKYVEMTDMSVGRNVPETLRILDALIEGGLCPCNWKKGESTLKV